MILNLKLYATLNGSGSYALLVKLWSRRSCYRASVPLPMSDAGRLDEIRSSFSKVRSTFIGLNEEDWQSFDSMLSQLGGKDGLHPSLSLAMSLACARAASAGDLWRLRSEPKRFPYIAGIAARGRSWKEFYLIPRREKSILDAFRSLVEAWKVAGDELKAHGVLRGRTSTGAWVADLEDTEMLYLLSQVAGDWGMDLGVNVGAGPMWNGNGYDYGSDVEGTGKKVLRPDEHNSFVHAVMEHYGIAYIEDPFQGSDFVSHGQLSSKFPDAVVAGASMYRADPKRMKMAHRYRPVKAVAVRPADLRTVSQLSSVMETAVANGQKLCLSMFDDETEDSWISDLSLAFGADMLKLGVTGVANTSKYGRLLEIWDDADGPTMGRMGNY